MRVKKSGGIKCSEVDCWRRPVGDGGEGRGSVGWSGRWEGGRGSAFFEEILLAERS